MSSSTVHLPDPHGPDDERYVDTLHSTWTSIFVGYPVERIDVCVPTTVVGTHTRELLDDLLA